MRKLLARVLLLITSCAALRGVSAQQHRHPPQPPAAQRESVPRRDTTASAHADTMRSPMHMMTGPLGISINRKGSGTSWLLDSSPMYAYHRMSGDWLFTPHGNAFVQYIRDGSDRGGRQFGSTNWVMGMASRDVGPDRLTL